MKLKYLKLDNAATMYAAAYTKYWSRTFRVSFVLDSDVKPELLKQAAADTAKRIPSFNVILRDGFFWNYFEQSEDGPEVAEETDYPYRPIPIAHTRNSAFRILYYKRRITLEGFHSVTDGSGTRIFLKSLVARYLELTGVTVGADPDVLRVSDEPRAEEINDDYYRYADRTVKAKNAEKMTVYHYEDNRIAGYAGVTHGLFPVSEVKLIAHEKGLTVTEYLTALLIHMFISCEKKPITDPVSISVPIDLRPRFPSESVRNFVFMTDVSFNPGGRRDISFDEICSSIKGKLGEKATSERLRECISSNVAAASSPVLKIVPYPIKHLFLRNTYKKVQLSYTLFFSNLGEFKFPEGMDEHIVGVESQLGDSPYLHFGCSSVSYDGILNFTFTSGETNMEKQRFFFRFLADAGVHLRIESNDSYSMETLPEVRAQ